MKNIFTNQLETQGVQLSEDQFNKYFNDFAVYCEEMEFATYFEIKDGAIEYITCQIHYGIFK